MRSTLLVALFLSVGCSGCASTASEVPKMGLTVPDPGTTAGKCARLEEFKDKYRDKLRLGDWEIEIACLEIPEAEAAWALSYVEVHRRRIVTAVDPDTPDLELTVAHEMLHAILSQLREADNELSEEQEARTLSELILCRPKLDGDQ